MIADIDVEDIEVEAGDLKKMIKDREAERCPRWDPEKKEWAPKTEKENK